MKNVVPGILMSLVGIVVLGAVYKDGYNKGVSDCNKTIKLMAEVAKAVKKGES